MSQTNIISSLEETKATKGASQAGAAAPKADVENAVLYTLVALIDSVNISTNSAEKHAEELEANAKKQEELNDELKGIKYNDIPKIQYKYRTVWKEATRRVGPKGWVESYEKKVQERYVANNAAIAQAEELNQDQQGKRQRITDKLNLLRQSAQLDGTHENTISNNTMQITKATSSLINELKQLTDQILIPKRRK